MGGLHAGVDGQYMVSHAKMPLQSTGRRKRDIERLQHVRYLMCKGGMNRNGTMSENERRLERSKKITLAPLSFEEASEG